MELVRQGLGIQPQGDGGHAAADIHPHGGGADGPPGGDDAAHGAADPGVDIGHHRHVVVEEGQPRHRVELRQGLLVDVLGVDLDRDGAGGDV
jgi:hypothetical protein